MWQEYLGPPLRYIFAAGPLLLLDIDGILNPWAAAECPSGYVVHRWWRQIWSRPEHGTALRDLAGRIGAELVWASSWAHDTNTTVVSRRRAVVWRVGLDTDNAAPAPAVSGTI